MQSRRHHGLWLFLIFLSGVALVAASPTVSTYQALTNALQTNDEILIPANSTINFPAPISINRKVKITGAAGSTFDGQSASQFFLVTQGGDLTLANLELRNARNHPAPGLNAFGGAIAVQDAMLVLSNCIVLDNVVMGGDSVLDYSAPSNTDPYSKTNGGSAYGGSVSGVNATVVILNSSFMGNSAIGPEGKAGNGTYYLAQPGTAIGGAVYLSQSALAVHHSWFNGNSARTPYGAGSGYGGGIAAFGSLVRLDTCSFTTNEAINGAGGAFVSYGTNTIISDSRFVSNSCFAKLVEFGMGGAILAGTSVEIYRSVFRGNCATGGIGFRSAPPHVFQSGAGFGGAVAFEGSNGGKSRVENCLFLENLAVSPNFQYGSYYPRGGALAIRAIAPMSNMITQCTFISNQCVNPFFSPFFTQTPQGTAIYAETNVFVTLSASIISASDTNTSIAGNILDGGWNVYSENVTNLIAATSVKNIDPKLLIDTNSYSLVRPAPDSPAINRVANTQLLPTDLRGVARPLTGSDSGAVELEGAPALTIARASDQLRLQTVALVPADIFASANLLDWHKLATLPPSPSPEPASYTITNQTSFQFYQAKASF